MHNWNCIPILYIIIFCNEMIQEPCADVVLHVLTWCFMAEFMLISQIYEIQAKTVPDDTRDGRIFWDTMCPKSRPPTNPGAALLQCFCNETEELLAIPPSFGRIRGGRDLVRGLLGLGGHRLLMPPLTTMG
jgi:hypothetical protein